MGGWLLIPEHLRLGTWDLLKSWTETASNDDIDTRLAMQIVNEASLTVTGVRKSRKLNHQGFELANGLPFIATDQEMHRLLEKHTIEQAKLLQINLGLLRSNIGDYQSDLLIFDPHRITSYSKRIMVRKKSKPQSPSKPVLQTFFSIDAQTGQPVSFVIGSSGKTTKNASIELLDMVDRIFPSKERISLLADTEHESVELIDYIIGSNKYDILMPVARRKNTIEKIQNLDYKQHWPGYATAETTHKYKSSKNNCRLIGQRTGEKEYTFKPFLATGGFSPLELITEKYPKRWTIEEFFNFEGAIGWNRASTLNLNILYGKMSLALIAQSALYHLKKKLPKPYSNWCARHFADSFLRGLDGDLRVKNDTIVVTYYGVPENLGLRKYYENLPDKLNKEGVNPRIPWLYNFKLDFRFK